jgi:hypothetical protein
MTPERKKVVRNAVILALVALAFYVGIIVVMGQKHP